MLGYLLVHDAGQLPGQVPVAGLHLVVVLLLVLLDQPLVHPQGLPTGVHKLPELKTGSESKWTAFIQGFYPKRFTILPDIHPFTQSS